MKQPHLALLSAVTYGLFTSRWLENPTLRKDNKLHILLYWAQSFKYWVYDEELLTVVHISSQMYFK